MILLLITGIGGYLYSPEYIDNLGMYMLTVVIPIVGYILGDTLRKSEPTTDNTTES